jgi:hypothetical protein
MKRFTVSLEQADYDALLELAKNHRPKLSLQYVVRYIIQTFLDENEGKQLKLDLTIEERTQGQ